MRANLAYGLEAPQEGELREALSATGLAPALLDRRASELSGGEAGRVAVARALTRDPGALLLDEPTAALDRDSAAAVEALVRELAGRGLGVLVVTHDDTQAERIADERVEVRPP